MIRKSLEWFGGSVLVYVLVAACSGVAENKKLDMGSGGMFSMLTTGDGDGDSATTGGSATETSGASGDGDTTAGGMGMATTGDGDSTPTTTGPSTGDGDMMTGIMDPVPDADAAEDGTRIVNLYRTTADGLKAPHGYLYWDKELEMQCYFLVASDGKERCLPPVSADMASTGESYFTDASCTQKAAIISKAQCAPKVAYGSVSIGASSCASAVSSYAFFMLGAKSTTFYTRSGESCVQNESFPLTYDIYALGPEIPASTYSEGTLVHD